MNLRIDFAEPLLPADVAHELKTADLDDFYAARDNVARNNLFFVLLASYQHYATQDDAELAAHLAFLLAYYLFVALTPPASAELAAYYIGQAISFNRLNEYEEWRQLIERGN
ncbi:MAG: hypothetical protein IJE29_02350 [Firmicutes bacterium]|nr:hypothetical protein [Bacillota bacterium]